MSEHEIFSYLFCVRHSAKHQQETSLFSRVLHSEKEVNVSKIYKSNTNKIESML